MNRGNNRPLRLRSITPSHWPGPDLPALLQRRILQPCSASYYYMVAFSSTPVALFTLFRLNCRKKYCQILNGPVVSNFSVRTNIDSLDFPPSDASLFFWRRRTGISLGGIGRSAHLTGGTKGCFMNDLISNIAVSVPRMFQCVRIYDTLVRVAASRSSVAVE
jgi:hypothetical protein